MSALPKRWKPVAGLLLGVLLVCIGSGFTSVAQAATEAQSQAAEAGVSAEMFTINNLWIMICGCMVFVMHLGFASLETGLTRAKNTVNILFKNTMVIAIGILSYAAIGFSLMYPAEGWNGFVGLADPLFGISPGDAGQTAAYDEGFTYYTDFFFQAMFAATAATIISGAVAERIKLGAFLVFITAFVTISYPITGSWVWGEGWLDEMGFIDFAGSTLVHSVGAWGALVAVILLGPRLGKFGKNGEIFPIPGHNLTLAAIGVFLLWFGWFGFNGGSVLSADPAEVSLVLVTTSLAAAAGAVGAAVTSALTANRTPDLTMALNGILAGLVGITASADLMNPLEAVIIGLVAGVAVVFAVLMFDRLRVDDPVGAISVHGVCGVWGTLAPGIFGADGLIQTGSFSQLGVQAVGIVAIMGFTLITATIIGLAVKYTMGLRVAAAEELEGLDLGEHDMSAYPDFQRTYIKSYHAREL